MNHPNIILVNTMVRHNDRLARASDYHRFRTTTWQDNKITQPQRTSRLATFLMSLTLKFKGG